MANPVLHSLLLPSALSRKCQLLNLRALAICSSRLLMHRCCSSIRKLPSEARDQPSRFAHSDSTTTPTPTSTTKTPTTATDGGDSGGGGSGSDDASGKRIKPQGWISRILNGPQGVSQRFLQSHSSILSDSGFIYEIATHNAKPGERENYLALFKEYANEIQRMNKECDLLGSWKVYYSNRDQCVHLWRFRNGYEGIDRAMKLLLTDTNIKKLEQEMSRLLVHRESILARSFSYWAEPEPRPPSSIYELRSYILRPGTLIEWGAAWARGIEHRRESNQDVGGFFSHIGPLHRVFHLWAYPNLVGRHETRQETWAKPGWDQTVSFTVPLIKRMESRILIPNDNSQLK